MAEDGALDLPPSPQTKMTDTIGRSGSRVLICADASMAIGTGHVMRCLAIAQAWKRAGGSVDFLLPEGLGGIAGRISTEGFSVQTFPAGARPPFPANSDHYQRAILDGYSFGRSEQTAFCQAGIPLLFVDDYGHANQYSARWVLNPNLYAVPDMYSRRKPDTQLLLGPTYALLREEFLKWIGWKRPVPERATKILVTMGGSDAGNASLKILHSLAGLAEYQAEVILVLGMGNPHEAAIRGAVDSGGVRARIVRNALDMPALMAWADVAIAAAGGTSYELCYMGLPSVLLVAAENQRKVAESLSMAGGAAYAGTAWDFSRESFLAQLMPLLESQEQRTMMSQKAREIVDGLGTARVRAALLEQEIRVRPANESDGRLLFSWANDTAVRKASFHSDPIAWDEHERWFAGRLKNPRAVIYVGENRNGEPVGNVRFDLDDARATLSVSVAPQFRGRGWGKELIWFATRTLLRSRFTDRIDAFVKPDNEASLRLFESAGFRRTGADTVAGQPAVLFTWRCESGVHAG